MGPVHRVTGVTSAISTSTSAHGTSINITSAISTSINNNVTSVITTSNKIIISNIYITTIYITIINIKSSITSTTNNYFTIINNTTKNNINTSGPLGRVAPGPFGPRWATSSFAAAAQGPKGPCYY